MHNKKIIIFFIFIFVYFESVFSQETRLFSILKKKEIVVSVAKTYEPFYIEDPNEGFPGFDVDFAKKYAKFLDVNIKIIPLGDFEDQARAIVSGKVDIAVAGISSHLARAKEVNFSDPYLITTPAGLVNKQSLPPEPEGQIVVVKPFKDLLDLKFQ
ncbi:MAG: transporter substrate-binding domain-containing protein, partial [Leptospiraceae bacterium]|nr:transporter substrate-binding domain-containing protein [Leptospiraceae bacterium]